MAIDFPPTPTVNDTYTFSSRTWKWNGSGWESVSTSNGADLTFTADSGTTEGTDKYTFNLSTPKTLNFVSGNSLTIAETSGAWTFNVNNATGSVSGAVTTVAQTFAGVKTFANTTATTSYSTGALLVSGGVGIANSLTVANSIFVGSGSFSGIASSFSSASIIAQNSGGTYAQIAMVNTNSSGSADFAAFGDGASDVAGWVDMGFTGSAFSDATYTITGKNDGYVFVQPLVATNNTGNLVLATGANGNTAGKNIIFATGGFAIANEKMRIAGDGNVGIGGTSTGSKLYVVGTIESTSGGIKFPDGTTQTSAASGGDLQYLTTVYR